MKISSLSASRNHFLHVNLDRRNFGMFSVFNYVVGVLYNFDVYDYAGIEIDFKENGLYFDPEYGPNWWNYYCEPICIGDKKNTRIKQFSLYEHVNYALFVERKLNREQVFELIQKYIKIKDNIQQKVEEFVVQHFTDYHIIGVHFRGTDKKEEARRVPFPEVASAVNKYINTNGIQNCKIFVASDEEKFVEYMRDVFGDLVIAYSAVRTKDNNPLHLQPLNKYLHGQEALIDCLLLSKGDVLIKTSSNLSLWSSYFNPTIPVIELNKRYIDKRI